MQVNICILVNRSNELVFAQQQTEIDFSRFYNSAQYLNTAFAGDVRHMKPIAGLPIINSQENCDIKWINYLTG